MSGEVKDDTTLTDTSKKLKTTSDVSEYKGPKLRVGVVNFQNKTPSKVLGVGEAAADILGTIKNVEIPDLQFDEALGRVVLQHLRAGDTGQALKALEASPAARQQPESARMVDVPHFLGERPVTIDEDGGPRCHVGQCTGPPVVCSRKITACAPIDPVESPHLLGVGEGE